MSVSGGWVACVGECPMRKSAIPGASFGVWLSEKRGRGKQTTRHPSSRMFDATAPQPPNQALLGTSSTLIPTHSICSWRTSALPCRQSLPGYSSAYIPPRYSCVSPLSHLKAPQTSSCRITSLLFPPRAHDSLHMHSSLTWADARFDRTYPNSWLRRAYRLSGQASTTGHDVRSRGWQQ